MNIYMQFTKKTSNNSSNIIVEDAIVRRVLCLNRAVQFYC